MALGFLTTSFLALLITVLQSQIQTIGICLPPSRNLSKTRDHAMVHFPYSWRSFQQTRPSDFIKQDIQIIKKDTLMIVRGRTF